MFSIQASIQPYRCIMAQHGRGMAGHPDEEQIRRNAFRNLREFTRAITEFIEEYQKNPRPFVWSVDANAILRKVAKLRQLQAK